MKRLGFPKNRRLVSNRQFKAVLNRNRRAADKFLTLFVAENTAGHARLGVSIGKSCGAAAVRNRVKRLLREAFRQSQDRVPQGFDYVLMIPPSFSRRLKRPEDRQKALAALTFQQAQESFLALTEAILGDSGRRGDEAVAPAAENHKAGRGAPDSRQPDAP